MTKKYPKIKQYYDTYGKRYDDERIIGYYSFINDIEVDTISEYAEGKKVLEIGCGTGIILKRIAKIAKEAWGVDLSSGMLKKAKEKDLNVKQANATQLPFKDSEFDVVYSVKVLAHIPDIEKVIEEVHRVLKKDGMAVLEFYNPKSFKKLANTIQKSGEKVFLRFDSHSDIMRLVEGKFKLIGTRGARIISMTSGMIRLPILGNFVITAEKMLAGSPFKVFAGYYIVILRKID